MSDQTAGYLCQDAWECFVTMLDYGIRAGGGVGDLLGSPDYTPN